MVLRNTADRTGLPPLSPKCLACKKADDLGCYGFFKFQRVVCPAIPHAKECQSCEHDKTVFCYGRPAGDIEAFCLKEQQEWGRKMVAAQPPGRVGQDYKAPGQKY